MVGHLGAAPSVSPLQMARIAVFLVPDRNVCTPLRRMEIGASCRFCPGALTLEESHASVTPMTREKWWLRSVSHRTLLVFSEALICLSYAAVVPLRGNAPRSIGYQPVALLLSYRGMKGYARAELISAAQAMKFGSSPWHCTKLTPLNRRAAHFVR